MGFLSRGLSSKKIGVRFAVTVVANIVRSFFSYLTGLMVARSLGPAEYGDFVFLLGAFIAIKQLLDLGSSNAFFTFISQKRRSYKFYVLFYLWLLCQFCIIVGLLWFIVPGAWIKYIWLGHDRSTLLLAFTATFLSLQVWQSISYVGEAARETTKVQMISTASVGLNLGLVVIFISLKKLSLTVLFSLMILQYALVTVWAWRSLGKGNITDEAEPASVREILAEYRRYCLPLILYSLFSFAFQFLDRWFLQHYAGPVQQGFYGVSERFSAVSLLATTSILKIFWKETSEAHCQGKMDQVRNLYYKSSRLFFFLGAALSGLLIPWTSEIIAVMLGPAYQGAKWAFALMLFYPIYQSLGQISSTLFCALGRTKEYMVLGVAHMGLSIPVAFCLLAPRDVFIFGLGLGALGMAIKIVSMETLFVNLRDWTLTRIYGWPYRWGYQALILGLLIPLGYASTLVAKYLVQGRSLLQTCCAGGAIALVIYGGIISMLVVHWPRLLGLEPEQLKGYWERFYAKTIGQMPFTR